MILHRDPSVGQSVVIEWVCLVCSISARSRCDGTGETQVGDINIGKKWHYEMSVETSNKEG